MPKYNSSIQVRTGVCQKMVGKIIFLTCVPRDLFPGYLEPLSDLKNMCITVPLTTVRTTIKLYDNLHSSIHIVHYRGLVSSGSRVLDSYSGGPGPIPPTAAVVLTLFSSP